MVLILVTAVTVSSSVSVEAVKREVAKMNMLIDITQEQLLEEGCTDADYVAVKRNVVYTTDDRVHLELLTKLFQRLRDRLVQCRNNKVSTTPAETTTTPETATTTSSTSATRMTSTTAAPSLLPCRTAINLTEPWRMDYSGSNLRPVKGRYNGDTKRMTKEGRPWFRFSGEAGNALLNRCIKSRSCGTSVNFFSNSTMPTLLGVITPIELYGANDKGNCQYMTDRASVIRCSKTTRDFIYRYDGDDMHTDVGFCGMI